MWELYLISTIPNVKLFCLILGTFNFVFLSLIYAYVVIEKKSKTTLMIPIIFISLMLMLIGIFAPNEQMLRLLLKN